MRSLYRSSEDLNRWLASRRWRIFAFCLPVLLAGVVLAIVVGIVLSRENSEVQRRYDLLARTGLATGNYEVARVASLRGLNGAKNERDRAQWIFYLALAMNGQGHEPEAEALVAAAAPLDPPGAGSVEAHLSVAQNLLSTTDLRPSAVRAAIANPSNSLAITLDIIKRHLLSAVAIEPDSLAGNEMLGRFYINTHQPEKAQERLLKIYAARPETALLLAIASDSETNTADAVQWADRALTVYENNLLRSAPRYSPDDRLGLVRALSIQRKYTTGPAQTDRAITAPPNTPVQDSPGVWLGIVQLLLINDKYGVALQTLEQRMIASSNAAYSPMIARICTALAQSIRPKSRAEEHTRLHFVLEGLTNAPDDLQLQVLLLQASHAPGDSGALARKMMATWATNSTGETAATWQFVLWTDYRVRGDMVEGRKHLQRAHELAPDNPLVLNDMAVDLASGDRKSWARALDIIQPVVDQFPYDPLYRDTRGEILALLGRNQEARADLEFAAQRFESQEDTQRALAKVDAALGIVRQDDTSGRLVRVQSLVNDGDYAGAVKMLEQALSIANNPTYAKALADVCHSWVEYLPLSRRDQRLQLIEKGLSHDPADPKLQALLVEATQANGDSGRAAQKFLDQLVATAVGDSAAEWHLSLGRDARRRGDMAGARRHLEIALGIDPKQTQAQIEMAMVLAGGNQEDLERGLQLIGPVVEKFPGSADFRNVRGRILAHLGRNKEAVDDLSFAADNLADPAEAAATRRILADVYKAMGKPQLEEQQRRMLYGQ